MKQLNIYKVLLILGLCMVHSPLYAHGIKYSLGSGGIVVHASFDNNQPASGLFVAIFAPESSDKFQTGKTDLNGRFVFFPDRAGDWEALVFDQMGHRLEVMVPVDEALALQVNQSCGGSTENSLSRYERALMGISIIFGISGFFFWWRGRIIYRRNKEENQIEAQGTG
ncbi:MAG: hypothetical protein JRE23_01880 [Deltaproteobacteria bacterium]|nr:hypothetical protein [Deltaproteobacteria bacterium]